MAFDFVFVGFYHDKVYLFVGAFVNEAVKDLNLRALHIYLEQIDAPPQPADEGL